MKNRIFALLVVFAVFLNVVNFASANTKTNKNNELLALLPASDMAMTLDVKRLFDEALPQMLSANQPMLAEIKSKIDEIKTQTGLDVRQFQQVAVGVSVNKIDEKNFNFEPLVLARGQFSPAAILALAKLASKGKYREEKIGERSVYVFSPKELIEENKGKVKNSEAIGIIDKMLAGFTQEIALTTYNENTLAIGSMPQMRSMFEAKTRISPEIIELVGRKPNAVMSFGANVPSGLSQFMELGDDELGATLNSVRQLSGSMDVLDGNTFLSVMAKTTNNEQAKNLKATLDSLQGFFAPILKGSKGADKKVYAKMVENAKITQSGSQVMLDLKVPQADLDVIVGEKK
jgi:hypothetical protein